MKILFINLSSLKFVVTTPDDAPLGGSESAVCYLARALAQRGHDVALAANLPDDSGGINAAVRHFPMAIVKEAGFFAAEKFDVIIICNSPVAAPALKFLSPQSQIIVWAHALPDQPAMQPLAEAEVKQAMDKVVFVSGWQNVEIENAFGAFRDVTVIGNGIAPAFENMFASAGEILAAKENHAAYTTTPFRGLALLLNAMEGLDRVTTLDVFSSMKLYQVADDAYAPLYAAAARDPAIAMNGAVSQNILAQSLRGCAFLFYPCIFPETFCITAAEAMAAGIKIVSTHLGALPDTTMGFANLVPILSLDGAALVRDFRMAMQREIDAFVDDPHVWAQDMFEQSRRANEAYSWAARAVAWEEIMSR